MAKASKRQKKKAHPNGKKKKAHEPKFSRHHIRPKSDGGKGLKNNIIVLEHEHHKKIHELDAKIDKLLVKKDNDYYFMLISCAYKMLEKD